MGEVSTIGLDIAKSVFQVHGVDGVRSCLASRMRRQPAARGDPRHWADCRHPAGRRDR